MLHSTGEAVDRQWCRSLLLFAYGTVLRTGTFGAMDDCTNWAVVALPDLNWLHSTVASRFAATAVGTAKWPPILKRSGGIFFDVGSWKNAQFVRQHLLQWRPQHVHFFEPWQPSYSKLVATWRKRYQNVTFHNYGLGAKTAFSLPFFDDGIYEKSVSSSNVMSAYHQLNFVDGLPYLEAAKARHRPNPEHTAPPQVVSIRAVVDVWHALRVDNVALLSMNCEGCEFQVVQALADGGLLEKVGAVLVQGHVVLDDIEVAEAVSTGLCDVHSGRCSWNAVAPAVQRYCALSDALARTHRKVLGLPFQSFELWHRM